MGLVAIGLEGGGRNYLMSCSINKEGLFVSLKVVGVGGKTFSIFIPKGFRKGGAWQVMANSLRELGVVPFKENQMKERLHSGIEEKGSRGIDASRLFVKEGDTLILRFCNCSSLRRH